MKENIGDLIWKGLMAAGCFAGAVFLTIIVANGHVEPTMETAVATLVLFGNGVLFLEMRPLEFDDEPNGEE